MEKLVLITYPRGETSEIFTFEGISVEDAQQKIKDAAKQASKKLMDYYEYYRSFRPIHEKKEFPDTSFVYNGYVFNCYPEIVDDNYVLSTLDELFERNITQKACV